MLKVLAQQARPTCCVHSRCKAQGKRRGTLLLTAPGPCDRRVCMCAPQVLEHLQDPRKEPQLRRIADNANRFAARYLTSSARRAYWMAALRRCVRAAGTAGG